MILYPAIDIRGGRAVRLTQGDYEREKVFDDDPLEAARRWVSAGAQALHVVDLDGAREGRPVNAHHIERIARAANVPVQVGGGLRDSVAVEKVLAVGAERVVLGTAALENPDLVRALVETHGDRILVSLDTRAGRVAHSGWVQAGEATPRDLARAMTKRGVRGFVHTPIEVDGTLAGPAIDDLSDLAAVVADAGGTVIYSGGIGALEHLRTLAGLGLDALDGVIVGMALYEGRFTVGEGQAALDAGA